MQTKRLWTAEEDKAMREIYPHVRTTELARQLSRSECSVYMRSYVLGISKSAEYLAGPAAYRFRRDGDCGRAHRYKAGNVPANKGLRGRRGWGPGRMKLTQFQQGNKPQTWRPVGSERPTIDGYLERKIAETGSKKDWKGVHVLTWEAANGPAPKGHAVIFKDGNKGNIAIGNLELVSRAELMRRNSVHRLPKEIALAIQLTGALKRQIRKHEKQNVGSSQPSL